MRIAFAHNNSPYFTVLDMADWKAVSGTPTLPSTGWAVEYIGSQNAIAIGHNNSPYLTIVDSNDYSNISYTVTSSMTNVLALALSPDESLLAVGGTADNVIFIDTATWTEVGVLSLPADVYSLSYSPDGSLIAVGFWTSPYFKVFETSGLTEVFAASEFSNRVRGSSFSPDGTRLAASPEVNDGLSVIYDTSDWSVVDTYENNGDGQDAEYSLNPGYLVFGHEFVPYMTVLNSGTLETVTDNLVSSDVNSIRFSPGDQYMALATDGSPYYAVFNTSDWSDAVDADFPASLASLGNAVAFIPDNSGGYAPSATVLNTAADATFDEADNVGSHVVTNPMLTYDSTGDVGELYEADYAVKNSVLDAAIDAQLELRGAYEVLNAVLSTSMTAFPGLEIKQSMPFATTISSFGIGFSLSSTFTVASSESIESAFFFVSKMGAASSIDVKLKGGMAFSDAMGMLDAESISHILELASTIGLGSADDINHLKAMLFIANMALGSDEDFSANFLVNFALAMTLSSLAAYGQQLELTSTMDLAGAFEIRYNAVVDAVSTMAVASAEDMKYTAVLAFISAFETESSMGTQAKLQMDFESLLGSYTVLKIGDDIFEGWVLSADDQAFSQYENYPFTSIASFKGKPYGVADDGLYLLEGDDDAGDPIQAALRTGFSAFGQRVLKDAKSAYIGYTSSGQMVLKVAVSKGGEKHEYWYQLKHGASDDMRTGRATIQRGLRSTYWQFELVNTEGADFEIDDVTIVYNILGRRIRR